MKRATKLILRVVWVAFAIGAFVLLWTSFKTGRQIAFGVRSSFNVSLQAWNGRVGVLYQARHDATGKHEWVLGPSSAPAELIEADRHHREQSPESDWTGRWTWRPSAGQISFDTFQADMPAWPLVALLATPLAVGVARRRRRTLRRQRGQCAECGYLVRELAVCPECGTAAIVPSIQ